MRLTESILSPLPGVLEGLRRADRLWASYREDTLPLIPVVSESPESLSTVEWDVVICGGTLGIVLGAALAQRGWRVALLERGSLRGRDQEWNISRRELHILLDLGLLSAAELEQAIVTEYNPARIGFHGGIELWVEDVLNIGVDPVFLLDRLKTKFLDAGGKLVEHTAFGSVVVHPNGIRVLGSSAESATSRDFSARLLLDAMGHFSPITRQARQGKKPDAVCLVVGTCAQGFPANETGDLFFSFTPIQNQCQYFWEAFPARDGRTTYLFTYLDAHPSRPSLEELFDDYFRLLPQYQGVAVENLQIQRALFGFFPCYRQSPLQPVWQRILPVGDSSGAQSPLSFGGFGAMIRHLRRLTIGIHSALENDQLQRRDLALLQPYQPNLAVTWLFQRAMSVGVDQSVDPDQINRLLSGVFQEMQQLGDDVLKPFLQDVVQFSALSRTLLRVTLTQPLLGIGVIPQVGGMALIEWLLHYLNLALYSGLYPLGKAVQPWLKTLPPPWQYRVQRWLDAWQYGSGQDYNAHP
ncbi:MAG: FAD-binding oxidoreductase [Synechococcales cyanobacterium M58_A2018_015]|nr:FAD-binding oxidoreductase [Synechococcales cyanobacterium M58_A2018_015]